MGQIIWECEIVYKIVVTSAEDSSLIYEEKTIMSLQLTSYIDVH